MNPKKLANCLRAIIVIVGLCGLAVYFWLIPSAGHDFVGRYPELDRWYTPWVSVITVTALPCYATLVLSWLIAANIGNGHAFCRRNASYFKGIAALLMCDSVFFLAANAVLYFLDMSHPGLMLMALIVIFFCACAAVCAAGLSYLCGRAAGLQEDSDLTI